MSKIKAKNTLYNDPRYDVVVDSRMLEQHLKEKAQQIAELQQQLEEKERLLQYGKTEIKKLNKRITDIIERDKKLLKSQPAEIVEKIKEFVDSNAYYYEEEQYAKHIIKYLDDILKEYQK